MRERTSESGFTIAEVLIALVLLAIGVLVVAQAFPAGSRRTVEDRMRSQAMQYANEKLEQLADSDRSGGALLIGAYGPETINDKWTCHYRVEAMPAPLDDLRRVTVWVAWMTTRPDTVSLVTYLGQ